MVKEQSGQGDELGRAVRIGQLLDLYGPLLTERQREFMSLHYLQDLSFGEIAREYGISRQAIHDAVKHGEQALEEYDVKLRLTPEQVAARLAATAPVGEQADGAVAPAPSAAPAPTGAVTQELALAVGRLESLHQRMVQSGGVIYNGDALARELAETIAVLRGLAGCPE